MNYIAYHGNQQHQKGLRKQEQDAEGAICKKYRKHKYRRHDFAELILPLTPS